MNISENGGEEAWMQICAVVQPGDANIAQSEQKQETQQAPERAAFSTKKATTIMPKEVFSALQMYCIRTDTPKHRAIYLFLIEGLRNAGQITEGEYIRYREMAAMMTTTYDKKQ